MLCYLICEEKFGDMFTTRVSKKLQVRTSHHVGPFTPCVSSLKIKVVPASRRVQVAYATLTKRYVYGKGFIPAHVAHSPEAFISESSQYKLHLVQALKPYDRCKLYKFSYEFQVQLEEASVAAMLNFQLRCHIALGWQNKPTADLRLGFSKYLQAIRHK